METTPKASLSYSLSRTRTLKMQRSGDVIIAKITHNDGTGITLGYRALLKLLAAGNFISEARRTLLYRAERERLEMEGHTPLRPAKRKLCFHSDGSEEDEESRIPPSGTPLIPLSKLELRQEITNTSDEDGATMQF